MITAIPAYRCFLTGMCTWSYKKINTTHDYSAEATDVTGDRLQR